MKRVRSRFRASLSRSFAFLLVTSSLVFIQSGTQNAFADSANPYFKSGSYSFSATTATPGTTITVSYTVIDDTACCNPHDAYMYDSTGAWVTRAAATKTGGSTTEVNYSVNLTVPSNATAGTYVVKSQTTDLAGKYTPLQELGSITVTTPTPTPTDAANPVMVVGSGVLSSSSMTTSGGSVSITYRLTDDLGCCGYHQAWMYYPNGTVVQQVTPSLIS